jgi:uncharacterized protein YchJ
MNLIYEDFNIIKGNIPIILSAPHCKEQLREGKIKTHESGTDTLAIQVSKKTNCSCIYKTKFYNNDPNWDEISTYKNELKEFINKNNIKYLLDFHGMKAERKSDICIGTGFFKNLCGRKDLLNSISKIFKSHGFKNISIDIPFSASNPNVISSFISSNCHIPCFQIEINNRFRSKKYNEYNLNLLVDVFIEIIEFLKKDI